MIPLSLDSTSVKPTLPESSSEGPIKILALQSATHELPDNKTVVWLNGSQTTWNDFLKANPKGIYKMEITENGVQISPITPDTYSTLELRYRKMENETSQGRRVIFGALQILQNTSGIVKDAVTHPFSKTSESLLSKLRHRLSYIGHGCANAGRGIINCIPYLGSSVLFVYDSLGYRMAYNAENAFNS
ncbi:MAG: hypothetical protein FJZ63_02325 [Chlamydiae bacterium]|nr:hypothetical protein [Chlamydiota bacterium]